MKEFPFWLLAAAISAAYVAATLFPPPEHAHERRQVGPFYLVAYALELVILIALAGALSAVSLSSSGGLVLVAVVAAFHGISNLSYRRSGTYLNLEVIRYAATSLKELSAHSRDLPIIGRDIWIIVIASVSCIWVAVGKPSLPQRPEETLQLSTSLLALLVVAIIAAVIQGIPLLFAPGSKKAKIQRFTYFLNYHAGPFLNFFLGWLWRLHEWNHLWHRERG